jgi:hypothetical protein
MEQCASQDSQRLKTAGCLRAARPWIFFFAIGRPSPQSAKVVPKIKKGSEDEKTGLSRDYSIVGNVIQNAAQAMLLEKTTEYYLGENRLQNAPLPPGLVSTMKSPTRTGLAVFQGMPAFKRVEEIIATKPKTFRYFREESKHQGRDLIKFGEFAPEDFRVDRGHSRGR